MFIYSVRASTIKVCAVILLFGLIVTGLALSGKDSMRVTVAGNEDRVLLIAAYDNLGKGASGAAIECMNMAIGAERTKGLML